MKAKKKTSESNRYLKFVIFVICIFLVVNINPIFGQDATDPNATQKIIPPSPEGASLGKYGEIPVNSSSGIPSINIPLFDLPFDKINIPISISYHGSGNKVNEISSNVGLGWTLNAGGAVTPTIMGDYDFSSQNLLNEVFTLDRFLKFAPTYNSDPNYNKDYEYALVNAEDGVHEPDIFYYNFLNYSGKFVLNPEGSQAYLIPYNDILVKWGKSGYEIIDQNGFRYLFETTEAMTNTRFKKNVDTGIESQILKNTIDISSTIYLTKIISPTNQTVLFEYDSYEYSYISNFEMDYTINNSRIPADCQCHDIPPYCYRTEMKVRGKRIKKITHQQNKSTIDFYYNTTDREDLGGTQSLTRITVSSNNNIVRDYSFIQTYFNASNELCPFADESLKKRLRLNSVIENKSNAIYTFDYNQINLPPRFSYAQDYWGYYNNNKANSIIHGRNGCSREPDINKRLANILQRVTYPTLGSTFFEWEPTMDNSNKIVDMGVRIKKITNYSRANAIESSKTFEYKMDDKSSNLLSYNSYSNIRYINKQPDKSLYQNAFDCICNYTTYMSSNNTYHTFGLIPPAYKQINTYPIDGSEEPGGKI
jgi:hypothetical protein